MERVEDELLIEIAKLRMEIARMRRTLERLAVVFDTAGKMIRLEEAVQPPWLDPTDPARDKIDRRRTGWKKRL